MLKLNLQYSKIEAKDIDAQQKRVEQAHKMIMEKTGKGADFLGWVNLPTEYDKKEYQAMKDAAKSLRDKIDILVVIGIGGSYLGTRAAVEMVNGLYTNDKKVKTIFVGNTFSATYTAQVLEFVKNKRFGICVVSKSGTTTEPAIAFRLFKELLVKQAGVNESKNLIVAITDKARGALKTLAVKAGYRSYIIPDDIGGRYSVLTPVGLFAMMVSGIDTDAIWKGAQKAMQDTQLSDLKENQAYRYATARYLLNVKYGYKSEMMVSYELQMQMFGEWWKQLFGESEGKEGKGLLPTSCVFSTDLHSLGQFIQEGTKHLLFETVINIKKPLLDVKISKEDADLDGLNYLCGKSLHEINGIAAKGVLDAHYKTGGVPNIWLECETMDAMMFGYLAYWFMKACAMSAYLLDINPFDQPGVEIYKSNMFRLLKKPGYDK